MCNYKEEKTTSTTLWEFLETNTVEIPIIQRDYAQGRIGKEKLREAFLSDLKEALDNKKALKLDFIYGSTENGIFQPLDGQQRLTTLWLLHWYIAYKAGKLSEVKETLGKFTYETRVSSREFCKKILELSANGKGNVVEHIKKQTWFYSEWLQDPTIQAMLNMIGGTSAKDGFEKIFQNITNDKYKEYWRLLTETKIDCPIKFYSLELPDFGLTDDLYIKMNARGKPLTSFENLKADVIAHINDKEKCQNWEEKRLMNQNTEEEFKETFAYKIDTAWTDLFWQYKSDNYKIDDAFFNFFARYFLNYLIVINQDSEEKIKENPLYIELYHSSDNTKKIEYNGFKNYETIFDEKCLKCLKKTLDNIAKYQFLFECFAPYWESSEDKKREGIFYLMPQYEKDKIKEITDYKIKGITDDERVIFFAICRYFEQIDKQDKGKLKETLKQWMRVVWNVVENSGANLVGKLRLISELSEHSHSMYDFLVDDERVIESDFASEQVKEEREKAKKIIKGKVWEKKIIEAEKTAFFKGAIRFLFRMGIDDKNNIYDWGKFDARLERVKRYFNSSGVKHKNLKFEDRDFEINKSNTFLVRNFINTFNTFDHGIYWIYLSYKANDWRKILLNNELVENINSLLDSDLQEPVIRENKFNNSQEQLAYEDLLNVDFIAECLSFFEYGFWIRPWSEKIILTAYNAKAEWKKYVVGSRRNCILAELEKNNEVETDKRIYSLPYYWGTNISFKYNEEEFEWKLNDDIICLSSEKCIFNASDIGEANEFRNKINSAIK